MNFLNSVLETLKKFWYFFVILALTGLVLFVSFVENAKIQSLTNLIKTTSENYKKQFDALQELTNKRLEEDQRIIQEYQERIQQIERKRAAELAKVNAKKIQVVDQLKNKSTEELAQKMKDEFKL
jgi:hypothetical protein